MGKRADGAAVLVFPMPAAPAAINPRPNSAPAALLVNIAVALISAVIAPVINDIAHSTPATASARRRRPANANTTTEMSNNAAPS